MSHTNDAASEEQIVDQQAEQEEVLEDTVNTSEDEQEQSSNNEHNTLKQLADDNYQKFLRVQADFDNFRRRSRLEKEDFAKYASQKLIEQLLPVYDNFDRALAVGKDSKDPDAIMKGVEMIFRQFAGVLEGEGVTPIEAVGEPFNPEYHQAIMQVESDEHEEGIVVEEVQKGYMLKDKVIRPSMVKVSS